MYCPAVSVYEAAPLGRFQAATLGMTPHGLMNCDNQLGPFACVQGVVVCDRTHQTLLVEGMSLKANTRWISWYPMRSLCIGSLEWIWFLVRPGLGPERTE